MPRSEVPGPEGPGWAALQSEQTSSASRADDARRATEDPRLSPLRANADQLRRSAVGLGIAIGAGIGTAIGTATDNIATWLPVGIGVGVAIGAGIATVGRR